MLTDILIALTGLWLPVLLGCMIAEATLFIVPDEEDREIHRPRVRHFIKKVLIIALICTVPYLYYSPIVRHDGSTGDGVALTFP